MYNNNDRFGNCPDSGTDALCETVNNIIPSDVSGEFIIPDYIPDAEKILLTLADPKIDGQFIEEDRIDYEGSIHYTILISTDENKLKSISYTERFDGSIEASGVSDECFAYIMPRARSVNARLINPRKIGIKTELEIECRIYCDKDSAPETEGITGLEDEMDIESDNGKKETLSILAAQENGIKISEDIELDSGSPTIKEIVMCWVTIYPVDLRIHDGEAEAKNDAIFNCIYETEDENFNYITKKLHLTQTVAIQDLTDGCDCITNTDVGEVKAVVQENSYGERRLIELDFEYDLNVTCLCNKETKIVKDMYSTGYESTATYETLPAISFKRAYSTNLSVNASKPRSDIDADNIKNIFTGNIRIRDVKVSYDPEKGKLYADGKAVISIVGENDILVENEKLFTACEFEYPFKCETDASESMDGCEFMANVNILSERFRLDSKNVFVDFEIGIKMAVFQNENIKYLSKLSINKDSPSDHASAPITLCYPDDSERLWDIAKRYKTTKAAIMNANAMISEDLGGKNVLIIPKSKTRKQIYSKIISSKIDRQQIKHLC